LRWSRFALRHIARLFAHGLAATHASSLGVYTGKKQKCR
jgi:hypothetical protein